MIEPLRKRQHQTQLEQIKHTSNGLLGTIKTELDGASESFGPENSDLLKFHGVYQQQDRDDRQAAKALAGVKPPSYMVRAVIPAGVLTAEQYLMLNQMADRWTPTRSMRVTTRQCVQLHGIAKSALKQTITLIHQSGLTTFSGSGDVERNVIAPPAPYQAPAYRAARVLATQLSLALRPQTSAYDEIWLDEPEAKTEYGADLLYGPQYLPRKFKTGVALIEDNAVDVHSQDVGLILVATDAEPVGVNVLVGGGLGMTHGKADTYARLATPLCSVELSQAPQTVRAIMELFRDYGDRTDRKHARLKYVVEECGLEAFRDALQQRLLFTVSPWVEIPPLARRECMGSHQQGDGKFFYGVSVPNGRIVDTPEVRLKTALRRIIETLEPSVAFTPSQDVLIGGLSEQNVLTVKRVLEAYRVPASEQVSRLHRCAAACPGPPTCGKALTESERVFPRLLDELYMELRRLKMEEAPITVRMTGCPNGCARPYTADIGLVGHKPGCYDIFIGGRAAGGRLAELYAVNVPLADIVLVMRPLLEDWKRRRTGDEELGAFYHRAHGRSGGSGVLTGDRNSPARSRIETNLRNG